MIWEAIHSLSMKLVHRSHKLFWIDSKGSCCCCSCSCSCSAFYNHKAKNLANCMIRDVIYSNLQNLLYRCSLIFRIDSKECCWCSCSTTAADAALLLQLQYYYCSCSTFSSHKAKFDSYMPNNSICCFYQPDLTSITAAAAAAVAALFWINAEYQTTSL